MALPIVCTETKAAATMRILSLELRGFKRMSLTQTTFFSITITDPVQLVLGTNGSGKSSMLAELTPLPADPANYSKDGSKVIRITHRGNIYTLSSTFAPKPTHSFILGGEELNPSGGLGVQKELVKKHFDITTEIHELMLGWQRFHNMGPTKRREWFTLLSDVSYDYAIKVFGKLKERERDISGALKLAKKRLVAEISKVITDEEEQKLRVDVDTTHRELNMLIEQSAPLDRPVKEIRLEKNQLEEELLRMSNKLLRMRLVAPYGSYPYGTDPTRPAIRDDWGELHQPGFTCLEQIDEVIDCIRHDITNRETLLNKAVEDYGKVKETIDVLTRTGAEGLKSLQDKMLALRAQRDGFLASRRLALEGVDALNASSALDTVYETLNATLQELPENEERRFTQARLAELNEQFLKAQEDRLRMSGALARLSSQRQHLQVHKDTNQLRCPECNHSWVAGYSEEKFAALEEEIATGEEAISLHDKKIEEIKSSMADIESYGNLYREYMRCTRSWPILTPLWNHLSEQELITRSPRKALALINQFVEDLKLERQAHQVQREIEELQQLIASAEKVGDANLQESQQKEHEIVLTIEKLTAEITLFRSGLGDYTQYRRQLTEAFALGEKIRLGVAQQEKLTGDFVEAIRRETLNHCVRQLQHSLAIKQETLNSAVVQKALIQDLEKQIDRLQIEEKAVKLMVQELSPTSGLIAEGLIGFIRNYTQQMNNIIRKVWTYPLQILECGISGSESVELDYRFPMMVDTKTNIVPDVRDGSTGQREIIDLAFKIVAMRYLQLAESPLILDEFAAAFDKQHREGAMRGIQTLMETQPFTQLFMVSHYENFYGAFSNSEICVLDTRNITVPEKYNTHVTMN